MDQLEDITLTPHFNIDELENKNDEDLSYMNPFSMSVDDISTYARTSQSSMNMMPLASANALLVPREQDFRKNSPLQDLQSASSITEFVEVSARVTKARELIKEGYILSKQDIEGVKSEIEMDEHLVEIDELVARLDTDEILGLSSLDVELRAKQQGKNKITKIQRPMHRRAAGHFFSGFSILLSCAALICLISYAVLGDDEENGGQENLYLGIILLLVVIFAGCFSFFQYWRREKLKASFETQHAHHAFVIRDGKCSKVLAEDLVVGDLVEIAYGDRIPADIRLTLTQDFKVDNSALTGEVLPQLRSSDCTDDNPLETKNLVFSTTTALEGNAKGIVIGIGDDTVIGRIAHILANLKRRETPIAKEIKTFVTRMTTASCLLAFLVFVLALVFEFGLMTSLLFFIAILLANIPEGLLMTMGVSLTLTASRLASKRVLVKNPAVVENLGCTSCICTDKTGTITQGSMTVNHIWYDMKLHSADPATGLPNLTSSSFIAMCKASVLCNDTNFISHPDPVDVSSWECSANGNPLDAALLRYFHSLVDTYAIRKDHVLHFKIPFTSRRKFTCSIFTNTTFGDKTPLNRNNTSFNVTALSSQSSGFKSPKPAPLFRSRSKDENIIKTGDVYTVYVKGAPERIISMSSTFVKSGVRVQFKRDLKKACKGVCTDLGNKGERLLSIAFKELDARKFPPGYDFSSASKDFIYEEVLSDLCFVGLISVVDPPRPTVSQAVATCRKAGIRVVMFTGDHPITAKVVARQVGIISGDTQEDIIQRYSNEDLSTFEGNVDSIIVKGSKLATMGQKELDELIGRFEEIVFARTTPDQKLTVVEAFQRLGYIVAVTGDGVNDSPALRAADVGVAMGITGTEVAKEVSDMIIVDDDFSSIVNGIEEGRLIFDNLKKSIAYTLTSNVPEVAPFLCLVIFGIPLALSIILVLIIDLGTDMYPAISLAYERPESDMMARQPRKTRANDEHLVNSKLLQHSYLQIGVLQAMAGFYAYFVVLGDFGWLPGDLIGIQKQWDDRDNHALVDSYGQFWDYESRKDVQARANSAFFIAILLVQVADLIICKTRRISIIHQGMRNRHVIFAIIFELVLGAFLCYTPGVNNAFTTRAIRFVFWLPALPFAILIVLVDEFRKWLIRKFPGGWMEREFHY